MPISRRRFQARFLVPGFPPRRIFDFATGSPGSWTGVLACLDGHGWLSSSLIELAWSETAGLGLVERYLARLDQKSDMRTLRVIGPGESAHDDFDPTGFALQPLPNAEALLPGLCF